MRPGGLTLCYDEPIPVFGIGWVGQFGEEGQASLPDLLHPLT